MPPFWVYALGFAIACAINIPVTIFAVPDGSVLIPLLLGLYGATFWIEVVKFVREVVAE